MPRFECISGACVIEGTPYFEGDVFEARTSADTDRLVQGGRLQILPDAEVEELVSLPSDELTEAEIDPLPEPEGEED